jgi:Coenzyme PQQ synthesis protein D (PqqD)
MSPSRHTEVSPEAIDQGFVALRSPSVHTVEVDGEAVLLNEGRLHLLNATGALVWACFDGDGTIAEIAADISDGLGVPYDTVLQDTLAVARELGAEGLLDAVAPAESEQGPDAADQVVARVTDSKWASDPRFVDEPPNT